jgi:Flp pilus assembly pilin Flp
MLVWDRLRAFLKDESGATAIEYGLIAADIAVAVIAVVNGLDEETEYQIHVDLDAIELGRGPRLEPIFGPRVILRPCIDPSPWN